MCVCVLVVRYPTCSLFFSFVFSLRCFSLICSRSSRIRSKTRGKRKKQNINNNNKNDTSDDKSSICLTSACCFCAFNFVVFDTTTTRTTSISNRSSSSSSNVDFRSIRTMTRKVSNLEYASASICRSLFFLSFCVVVEDFGSSAYLV